MKKVIIIGAGFSGSLTALQLLKNSSSLEVHLIEKSGQHGPGLAFGVQSPNFKLNVRAEAMGAWPEAADDFLKWAQKRGLPIDAKMFVPRAWFGTYLKEYVELESQKPESKLRLHTGEVTEIEESSAGFKITLLNRETLNADAVVLALGNIEKRTLGEVELANIFHQPYHEESYQDIASVKSVFILGSGLSAIDVIMESEARNFRGHYTLLSRHARLPLTHPEPSATPISFNPIGLTLRDLLRKIRKVFVDLDNSQPVVDALRPHLQTIWQSFTPIEKNRFSRYLRPIWDSHRHRIPQAHAKVIQNLKSSGRLTLLKGRIIKTTGNSSRPGFLISAKHANANEPRAFDRSFFCAGFESDISKCDSKLMRELSAKKWLSSGPLGIGISLENRTHPKGAPAGLFLIGPLQKELLWEISAVRELREQAKTLSVQIKEYLGSATQ